ncbi:hypothetical protein [Mycolicibacterium holsaticum]|uniref:hypothetical protein n=1 Tax=Mycolicibacterium holsaticum TaxID=152142 RepID=UPI0013F4EC62|nr:hypothetical protein [Mycolicibacterium holsaticum]
MAVGQNITVFIGMGGSQNRWQYDDLLLDHPGQLLSILAGACSSSTAGCSLVQ